MPRSPKSHCSSEGSLDTPEVRRRVVRACQRCRLKKCKCDGATPCIRCKSDDAICAYGKHKKSERTVFRSGYVQMLERQHAQLIAGLQELYRRTGNGNGWTGPHPESVNYHPPLTHKILEALGVLHSDEWEDLESVDSTEQSVEKQGQDNSGWMYSETASSPPQAPLCTTSPTHMAFPQSTIMSKRRSNLQTDLPPVTQTLTMPLPCMSTAAPVKPEPYHSVFPAPMPAPLDTLMPMGSMNIDLDRAAGSMMDWSFGMDDLFANLGGQEQLVNA